MSFRKIRVGSIYIWHAAWLSWSFNWDAQHCIQGLWCSLGCGAAQRRRMERKHNDSHFTAGEGLSKSWILGIYIRVLVMGDEAVTFWGISKSWLLGKNPSAAIGRWPGDIPITSVSDAWKGNGETSCAEASDDEWVKCQIFNLRILRCTFVMLERFFHHYTWSTWAMQWYDSERCLLLARASFQGRNNHLPNCKTLFSTHNCIKRR